MPTGCAAPTEILSAAFLRFRPRWPAFHALLLLCDLILDRSVGTVATNGQELLVNPEAVAWMTEDELQTALLAAVLDGAFLHAERPENIHPAAWNLLTARRTQQALRELGAVTWTGITWPDRLRAPLPGVDVGKHWGLVRCLARQLSAPEHTASLASVGLAPETPCLICEAGGHPRTPHPALDAILSGQPGALFPARAIEVFRLVCDLTGPTLSIDQTLRGLEWLARFDTDPWMQAAIVRLCASPDRRGPIALAIQQNPLLRSTRQRSVRRVVTRPEPLGA